MPGHPKSLVHPEGFTLIELLSVMCIIALLAGLTFPALSGLQGKAVTTAGNQVADLVNQARQNSLAKGAMTALVLLKNSPDPRDSSRALVLVEKVSGSATWKALTRWKKLPDGVIIDLAGSSDFIDQTPLIGAAPDLPAFAGSAIRATDCAYQVFLPGGNLALSSSVTPATPVLRVAEGVSDAAGQHLGNPKDYYDVAINVFTGLPKVDLP